MAEFELLASCWTWAGDAQPGAGSEVPPIPIAERLAAVQQTGWRGVGIVRAELVQLRDSIGLPALRALLDAHGVSRVELEFLDGWWADDERRGASDRARRDLFESAGPLGVTTVKVSSELTAALDGRAPVEHERFAAAFHDLAEDAARYGLRVAMEPMPMSNVPSIADACEMIREIDHPAAGLVIDAWHVFRSGCPFTDLPRILPADRVFVVEIDDAATEPVGDLLADSTDRRLIPGEGDLDVAAFAESMMDAGWRGPWGVEILSESHRAAPLRQALARTRDGALAELHRAAERRGAAG